MMTDIDALGRLGIGYEVLVTIAEMKHWEAERIYRFFCAIADAIRAARGEDAARIVAAMNREGK